MSLWWVNVDKISEGLIWGILDVGEMVGVKDLKRIIGGWENRVEVNLKL